MTRTKWLVLSSVGLAIAAGCGGGTTEPGTLTFSATLNGASERPTPNVTTATGTGTFTLSADGNTLTWNVVTTGLNNVIASHIHIGGTEVAGPIVLPLYAAAKSNNPPITGSITRAAFTSPLGVSFDGLIDLMKQGDTYVNVHTDDGVAPANTGPGDFPGGEIRGKIILQ
jgi:hypothetical protein